MNKRIIILLLTFVLIITHIFCGGSIPSTDSYSNSNSNLNKYDAILSIASYTKEQYDKGLLNLEYVIYEDNLSNFDNHEDIAEVFKDEYYFYKSTMSDENTIVVQKTVFFHSVTGYVATKNEKLNTLKIEGHSDPVMYVPSNLGYDGDIIDCSYIGKFDDWYLYFFRGGM
ncbi:MAG: hypothetical protein PUE12_14905 [Oscillospiraceae bacterium]|nr:hypothetical protein [Oscillospiraceae bacterium]